MTFIQIAGVVDGVALAAVTALGQAVPAWQPYCQTAVEVLGVIGTILGGIHAQKMALKLKAAGVK